MNDLISRAALLNSWIRIAGSWHLGNGKVQNFESIPVIEIENAPAAEAGADFSSGKDQTATAYPPAAKAQAVSQSLESVQIGKAIIEGLIEVQDYEARR